jgi:quinol monooxygenase YgiN
MLLHNVMFFSVVKIYPPPGSEHTILDVLESMKGPIATTADCLGCSITLEVEEGGAVCYTEQWRTREALERHLSSPLYSRVLEAMEWSRLPPEVEFFEMTFVGGLELVEKVRFGNDEKQEVKDSSEGDPLV